MAPRAIISCTPGTRDSSLAATKMHACIIARVWWPGSHTATTATPYISASAVGVITAPMKRPPGEMTSLQMTTIGISNANGSAQWSLFAKPQIMKDPIASASEMKTSATMATVPDFRMGPVCQAGADATRVRQGRVGDG